MSGRRPATGKIRDRARVELAIRHAMLLLGAEQVGALLAAVEEVGGGDEGNVLAQYPLARIVGCGLAQDVIDHGGDPEPLRPYGWHPDLMEDTAHQLTTDAGVLWSVAGVGVDLLLGAPAGTPPLDHDVAGVEQMRQGLLLLYGAMLYAFLNEPNMPGSELLVVEQTVERLESTGPGPSATRR